MKLHGFNRQVPVPNAHNHAIFRLSRDLEARRQLLANRVQRMISADLHPLRQSCKHSYIAMLDIRRLAMHWIIQHAQFAAECFNSPLQAQTDAEHRDASLRRVAHRLPEPGNRQAARARAKSESDRVRCVDELQREA